MEQKEDLGGYAGIHVPWKDENENGMRDEGEQAELNLYGEGTIIAMGGNAGDGVNSSAMYGGRWRADGAGARNRTETGGKGGNANSTEIQNKGHNMEFVETPHIDGSNPNNNTNCGFDGEKGENCGKINIFEDIKVYAYGGNGGAGGNGILSSGGGRRRLSWCWNWPAGVLDGRRGYAF